MLSSYHLFAIIALVLSAYAASAFSVKRGRLKLVAHRRLWNYLLLVSFLICAFLGLLMALLIDLRISIAWYREFLWVHVELGIIMAIISLIHVIWHWRYFWPSGINKK